MQRPIPGTISDAAKKIFARTEQGEIWSLDRIEGIRAEEQEEAQITNAPIIERYVESLQENEIGGVPVLSIVPKNYDSGNDDRCVLYFFGGAYVVGSPYVDLPIAARLAVRLGFKVHAPFYRRAPEHPCPAAIDDGFAVYSHLLEDLPANKIVVAGESAGGNLTLAVVLRARQEKLPLPAATALMSPWCDVTPSGLTQQEPRGFDPTMDYRTHLEIAAAAYAADRDQKDPIVSPLYADYSAGFPPTLITTGTREGFLSDCARLSTSMRQAGVDVRLHVWEGMWHTFEWYFEVPEADQSLDEIAEFLSNAVSANELGWS